MDKQSLLNKISFILQDLKTQHLKLTGNVDRIPEIDLDLFLANASFLVQHLEVLKKINGSSPDVRERDDILKNLFNPQELERLLEIPINPDAENKLNFEESSIPSPKEDPISPVQKEPVRENNQVVPPIPARKENYPEHREHLVPSFSNKQGVFARDLERKIAQLNDFEQEGKIVKKDEVKNSNEPIISISEAPKDLYKEENKIMPEDSLNDSFKKELNALREQNRIPESKISNLKPPEIRSQDSKISESRPGNFHEILSGQKREPSLLNKLGNLPVKDIRKAIGLNEHLLFIKTLFNGDPAIYDRTLTMIDSFGSSEEVFNFLNSEISQSFHWEAKKAVAELFKNIVNRKFASGR